jgi:cytochrome c-type biogenesis protein CcmH
LKKTLLVTLLLVGLASIAAQSVWAQGTGPGGAVTDDDVNRIAKQLFCPVCENVPLDVCPTQACKQWRATIREKLEAGWSEQQIKDYFAQQYGERVLAQPSTRGLNLFIWLIPPIAIAGGALVWWRFIRGMTQRRPAPATADSPPPVADDKYAALLEKELEKRR